MNYHGWVGTTPALYFVLQMFEVFIVDFETKCPSWDLIQVILTASLIYALYKSLRHTLSLNLLKSLLVIAW
jgi:hypothetical protein